LKARENSQQELPRPVARGGAEESRVCCLSVFSAFQRSRKKFFGALHRVLARPRIFADRCAEAIRLGKIPHVGTIAHRQVNSVEAMVRTGINDDIDRTTP